MSESTVQDLFVRLVRAEAAVKELEGEIRSEWWKNHGCPFHALYGDDGEQQCGQCRIDFKRMPFEELRERVGQKRMERLGEAVKALFREARVAERPRRGRHALPAGEALGEGLYVRLPATLHDRACLAAQREGLTVSEVIRIALRRMFRDVPGGIPPELP